MFFGTRLAISSLLLVSGLAVAEEVKLLREPDVHGNLLVFTYARDIWKAPLSGGEALRITSFQGQEKNPSISPDGRWVAFTGEYEGNQDVYVTALAGGEPTRLTFHPGEDEVVGWAPDGKTVLFSSGRQNAPRGWQQLWTVSVDGGMPARLPMNRAFDGSFASDSRHLVYRRSGLWDAGWRNYRGGQNQALRIIDLENLSERDLPWDNSLDLQPVWQGEHIYFLSNRSQVTNVFRVPAEGGAIEPVTRRDDFDVKGFGIDGDQLVYEYQGALYRQSGDGQAEEVMISLVADFPWNRPHWEDVSEMIEISNLSPTGKRALFVARGDVFTVPAEHGDARNLTDSSGSREVAAAWSPDGQRIAWFSDASGEYHLVIADQLGALQKEIPLAGSGFYSELLWSPDGSHLVFSDQRQRLWLADSEAGKAEVIAEQPVVNPDWSMAPSWSPDSRYVAFALQGDTFFRRLMIHDLGNGETRAVTDGMADVRYPVWDGAGDKLYFTASTDYGPHAPWLDLSTVAYTPTYGIYYLLLNEEAESPLLPRSDEEKEEPADDDGGEAKDEKEKAVPAVKLSLDNPTHRILPLGEAGEISELQAGKAGELFFLKQVEGKTHLHKYALEDRESTALANDVNRYHVSADGEQVLVNAGEKWQLFSSAGPLDEEAKTLNVDLAKLVDNSAEWQQIFREAWRFQRDYFYVSNLNGADWEAVYEAYQPLVRYVRHAADMTYLLDNLGAETSVGHSFTYDGDLPETVEDKVGLLGADLARTDKGYRFERIFRGENWFPDDQQEAPLGKLATQVREGDYLLSVNGISLDGNNNLYQAFRGTAGKQTRLSVSRSGRAADATDVVVVPVGNDAKLRRNAWVEDNRRRVDEASGGRLAYVWVPNTAEEGFAYFNRYFYPQSKRQGVIVDERFNHGGYIANYIIDVLRRERNGYFNNPFSPDNPMTSPGAGIWGPKVMLINEVSGSGGDMLPFMFRFYGMGTLVGKRTWGGLVGIWGVPSLVDGGYITSPRSGYYNLDGRWEVENEGVEPDVEVEQWSSETARGRDPQLEKAIEIALEQLGENTPETRGQPADPVRVPQPVQ